MRDIYTLARQYLSTEGLKLKDPQKRAVFEFADWLLINKPQCSCALPMRQYGNMNHCIACGGQVSDERWFAARQRSSPED